MKKIVCIIIVVMSIIALSFQVCAQEVQEDTDAVLNTRKYLGEVVYAGDSDGYEKSEKIDKDNPHFGWEIGNFYVSGFTRAIDENTKNPIFLKNAGNTVKLSFCLNQDISKLNNKEELSIAEDDDGYDEHFGIERTNFGKGMLIIRFTDYQGKKQKPKLYENYLNGIKNGANTEVQLCEEGDYEVALDYKIKVDNSMWLFWKQSTYDYKISFKFSVRNGNCMVFPRDCKTKNELGNSSYTENGFYLDFAKTKYLDIDVKKEILNNDADKLIEDTRFNKPGADGESYKDEGVYTITAKNKYTNQNTVKVIYVGKDNLLKAYAKNNISLSEIKTQIEQGAKVDSKGNIIYASESNDDESEEDNNDDNNIIDNNYILITIIFVSVICVIVIILVIKKRKKTRKNEE